MKESRFPRSFAYFGVLSAFVAAIILPGAGPGLGMVIIALLVAASVLKLRPSLSRHDLVCGAMSIVLMALSVLRDAYLILVPAFALSLWMGSLALSHGEGWVGLVRGGGFAGVLLPSGFGRMLRSVMPKHQPVNGTPVMRGTIIGGLLVGIFGALFASADAAFAHIAEEVLTPDIGTELLPMRIWSFVIVLAVIGSFGYLALQRTKEDEPPVRTTSRFEKWEWIIALGLLNALFASFVIVQLTILFGGRDHVLETAGLTYAQYARSGFFQLIAVSCLVLLVLSATAAWIKTNGISERLLLRTLQGILCVLTLVILASALRRLDLYEDTFGLTRLRISVHATILWLAMVFALVMLAGITSGKWLPRTRLYATVLGFLLFAFINPEARIAEHNVRLYESERMVDLNYLAGLSADAVPALTALPQPERTCVLGNIARRVPDSESWLSFNLARVQARPLLAGPPPDLAECTHRLAID